MTRDKQKKTGKIDWIDIRIIAKYYGVDPIKLTVAQVLDYKDNVHKSENPT